MIDLSRAFVKTLRATWLWQSSPALLIVAFISLNPKSSSNEICIVAGGLSARMGRDKSRMRLQGKTLLQHVQNNAFALGWPVKVIRRDLVPRCGPMGGVYTALKTSQARSVLFMACDMPFVSGAFLQLLAAQPDSAAEAIFVEVDGRVGFPFLLLRSALAQIEKQLASRQFSIEDLCKTCRGRRVVAPPDQSWMFLNINNPQDWQLARKIARKIARGKPLDTVIECFCIRHPSRTSD